MWCLFLRVVQELFPRIPELKILRLHATSETIFLPPTQLLFGAVLALWWRDEIQAQITNTVLANEKHFSAGYTPQGIFDTFYLDPKHLSTWLGTNGRLRHAMELTWGSCTRSWVHDVSSFWCFRIWLLGSGYCGLFGWRLGVDSFLMLT